MVRASCDCGAVTLEIAAAPVEVAECNCGICRRLGVLWVYYEPDQVRLSGGTDIYMRNRRRLEFHRCKVCGCTTHWAIADKSVPAERMGVNARLMEGIDCAAVPLVKYDGASR